MKNQIHTISIVIFFLFLCHYSFSQAFNDIEWYDVDSLKEVLPDQTGSERIKTLNALAASLSFEDKDKCRFYAGQALSQAEELKDNEAIAATYRNYGRMEFYDGNYPRALEYFQKSLSSYENQENKYMVAQLLEDLATTHFFARNLDKAFQLIHEALAVYRSKDDFGNTIGNARDSMTAYSRVGLPYRMTGRSDISKNIYLNYIILGKENNFEITDMMLHYGLLAMCYFEIGNTDSAFYYFDEAAKYPDVNLSIPALKHEHMRRMASIYLKIGQRDSAMLLLEKAYKWFSKKGFLLQSQKASKQLGDIFLDLAVMDSAKHYYYCSEALLDEMLKNYSYYRYDTMKYIVSYGHELFIPFTKKEMKEAIYQQAIDLYTGLFSLFQGLDKYQMANKYLISYSNAKDTLIEIVRNRESIEIQTRYETERKDSEIANLSQQNKLKELKLAQNRWFLFGLMVLVIIVILFALVLIRQNKLKNSQQILSFQQRLLRSQMNPHFIFNSLASIQNSIVNEEPARASKYLARFSKLVRNILHSSIEEYITLEEEITTIENYLELQKVRFPDKFDYEIEIDEELEPESMKLPPMLSQPFIENSIEHGFKGLYHKGSIIIRFYSENNFLNLEIEDSGIGRKKAQQLIQQQDNEHRSLATKLTMERIAVLNKKLKQKIHFNIIDLKDENGNATGTKVVFEIPHSL